MTDEEDYRQMLAIEIAHELARLMKVPGALDEYHGYMHGFHGFPFEGCDMTDLGPHEGKHFEAGLVKGKGRAKNVKGT